MSTGIEYLDETWNVATGCDAVSEGCRNCWARGVAEGRLRGRFGYDDVDPFAPKFWPGRLDDPLHWKKPRKIGVAFMSDLFHEAFTDEQIGDVMRVVDRCRQHTFMVLTKRPERMRQLGRYEDEFENGPLPNLHLGVTAENDARLDERIADLMATRAVVHFISAEPLLGPLDIRPYSALDWVIVGGETGPGARPMQPEWALDVWRQCRAAGVPFFFKQQGTWLTKHWQEVPSPWGKYGEFYDMVLTREFPAVTP